jgi:hypothetical protein
VPKRAYSQASAAIRDKSPAQQLLTLPDDTRPVRVRRKAATLPTTIRIKDSLPIRRRCGEEPGYEQGSCFDRAKGLAELFAVTFGAVAAVPATALIEPGNVTIAPQARAERSGLPIGLRQESV